MARTVHAVRTVCTESIWNKWGSIRTSEITKMRWFVKSCDLNLGTKILVSKTINTIKVDPA